MYNLIDSVVFTEDISLITLYNLDASPNALYELFLECEKLCVNVDMISQTAPLGTLLNVSFTVSDDSVLKILTLTQKYKDRNHDFSVKVSSGNCKITFYGKEMKNTVGVCATVFSLFSKAKADIKIITTSETEISVLTDRENIIGLKELLNNSIF
jgi:aspartokinase